MLDDKDIKKLKSVFPTKVDLEKVVSDSADRMLIVLASKKDTEEIKSDLGDLKELVQGLIVGNAISTTSLPLSRLVYDINGSIILIKL